MSIECIFDENNYKGENEKKYNFWARIFGTLYEDEIDRRSSGGGTWKAISGVDYKYIQKNAQIKLETGQKKLILDFLVQRNDKLYAVEAKIQPSANSDTINGDFPSVLSFALGKQSPNVSFQHLLRLGLDMGENEICNIVTGLLTRHPREKGARKKRGEEFTEELRERSQRENHNEIEYSVVQQGKEKSLAGFCLLLPDPPSDMDLLKKYQEIGIQNIFSLKTLWETLPKKGEEISGKIAWLSEFAELLKSDLT